MNVEVFKEAQKAYEEGDYKFALEGFTECMQDAQDLPPADQSKFYHLIGNCYVKSGDSRSAATAYTQALVGSPEKRKPSLYVNLGTALLGCGQNEDALEAFTRALDYPIYGTPYKAYSGVGAAQLKLGNTAEAGAAYREAAIDPNNPAPGKALVNLGVCFMELGRPEDAATSYETALQLDLDEASAAQAQANLGQAYMAQGRVGKAITAFEQATAGGAELSSMARHDYDLALTLNERLGAKVPGIFDTGFIPKVAMLDDEEKPDELDEFAEPVSPSQEMTPSASGHLPVFGEPGFDPFAPQTQAMNPVDVEGAEPSEDSDIEAAMDELGISDGSPAAQEGYYADEDDVYSMGTESFEPVEGEGEPFEGQNPFETPAGTTGKFATADMHMPSPEDTDFFDVTEAEITEEARNDRRNARRAKGVGLKIAIVIVVLLVVLAVGACVAYVMGYGYPLQEDVAEDFITAVQNDADSSQYWADDVDSAAQDSQEAVIDGLTSFHVEAVTRSMSQSTVYVKGTLEEGGDVDYELVMSRDGVSWAIEYVELYFASQE